jgi:uncharacterized membrane protein
MTTRQQAGQSAAPSTSPGRRSTWPRDKGPSQLRGWGTPFALLALIMIPVVAGSLRLLDIAGGPQVLPTNPRIDAVPTPVVIHIVAAAVYALFGAFQFPARLRRRHPGWHRRFGRVLVATGLVVAVSGLWMTLFYPCAPGGGLLWTVRLLVGSAMATSLALGFISIRRRDIVAHRAWMIRAYALAVGAGTQTFTNGIGKAAFGISDLSIALSMTSGWLVNAAVAEWVIRRHGDRGVQRTRTPAVSPGAP